MTKFLIQMSRDFATRSMEISDQSQGEGFCKPEINDRQRWGYSKNYDENYLIDTWNLSHFRWENTPHPYVFFNNDGHTVTFFGFFVDRNLNIRSEKTDEILHQNIISQPLYQALGANGVKFNVRLDSKSRQEKLQDLCTVFGIKTVRDVDASYELTSDNMMKMWVPTWLWRKLFDL